eukprot:3969831-Alexandrium_andersonii.AAC.1
MNQEGAALRRMQSSDALGEAALGLTCPAGLGPNGTILIGSQSGEEGDAGCGQQSPFSWLEAAALIDEVAADCKGGLATPPSIPLSASPWGIH